MGFRFGQVAALEVTEVKKTMTKADASPMPAGTTQGALGTLGPCRAMLTPHTDTERQVVV